MPNFLKNETNRIFFALFLGVIFGAVMKLLPPSSYLDDILVNGILRLVGNGFIELIKMTVVPLIFTSIICGVSSFGDSKKLGKIGVKTLILFLITTLIGVIISLFLAMLFKPGYVENPAISAEIGSNANQNSKNLFDVIIDMIPNNPFKSMSEGNLLQVLIFASFFGIAIGKIGEKSKKVVDMFNLINECIMKIVSMIIKITPFGVFALVSIAMYSTGLESLVGVLKLSMVVISALLVQVFLVYGLFYKIGTGFSFLKFLKNYSKIASIAFSTSSSNACLPYGMKMMEKIGVDKSIYQFILTLGSTINMAGTAIMQSASVIFISQLHGIELPLNSIVKIVSTSVLASMGAAGVPGVGIIMLTMVVSSIGLPTDGIAMIMGFDRILDMLRTPVNVMGDCVCSIIVAKSENSVDITKFNSESRNTK